MTAVRILKDYIKPTIARRNRQGVFEEQMALARKIVETQPVGLLSLIRLLGRQVQACEIRQVVDLPEHSRPGSPEFDTLFFSGRTHLTADGLCADDLLPQQTGIHYRLRLARDLILPWPWHKTRIADALSFIGYGKRCGPWKAELNHRVQLILPVGIGVVYGGNHSLAAGIVNGEGEVISSHILDLSPLYEYVRYDGRSYRRTCDDKVIARNPDPDIGAIFEIGRLMLEHGVQFDGESVNEGEFDRQESPSERSSWRYKVFCDDELQPYEVSESAVVNVLIEAGVKQGSRHWNDVLRGEACVGLLQLGRERRWRFQIYLPKPLYDRVL